MEIEMVWFVVVLLSQSITLSSSNITITNGPQNTTVCINNTAEIKCGFTGANPESVIPDWRIVLRSDNGTIISNITYNGADIVNGHINGLRWLADLISGNNNASNSKLLVGPVNKTYNQSSYQCIFRILSVMSEEGKITVVDTPSVNIAVDEICTTSIIISLSTHSHPACGDVLHNVTISGNVIYPDNVGGSKYTIDGLQSDTLYNITVTSTYNGGFKIFTKSVRTSLPKPPNPINATSIKLEKIDDNITIIWKPPEIDICSMLAVKYYDVKISFKEVVVVSNRTDDTAISFKHSDDTFTVNITVVDIKGQKSIPTIAETNIETKGIKDKADENTNSNIILCTIITILLFLLWQLL